MPGGPHEGPRVHVYVREGCHLCEEALMVVSGVANSAGLEYAVVDVDSDPELRREYSDHVPVTTVDGTVIARWFLSAEQLEHALSIT